MKHLLATLLAIAALLEAHSQQSFTHYLWVDNSTTFQRIEGASVQAAIDLSGLANGFHTLNHLAIDQDGNPTWPVSSVFLKSTGMGAADGLSCYAIVDNNEAVRYDCTLSGGMVHIDLDASNLAEGLHRLTVILANPSQEVALAPQSAYFIRLPLGGNGITGYRYWVNDDQENAVSVSLETPQNPLNLVSLLDVPEMSFRSTSFDFEIEDGKPVMYARNDLNIIWLDASNRFSPTYSAPFTDPRVRVEVNDIKELKPEQRETISRMAENETKWYKLYAEIGDSLVFNTDGACSLDLFSPTGEPMMSRTGYDSTKPSGVHARENGVHYLCVHEHYRSSKLNLDYHLIDKFAVLSYTPDRVAYTSKIFSPKITGNGLEYVKDIRLTDRNAIDLHAYQISATNSSLSAGFRIDNIADTQTQLDMILSFSDDEGNDSTITLTKSVTLEPPLPRDISVRVETERRVTVPYEVNVYITNNSNQTICGVPLFIAFDNPEPIIQLTFENFPLHIFGDDIPDDYCVAYYTDNLLGKGVDGVFIPIVLHRINPYQEVKMVFGLKVKQGHTHHKFYAWTDTPWDELVDAGGAEKVMALSQRDCPKYKPDMTPDVVDRLNSSVDFAGGETVGSIAFAGGETVGSIAFAGGETVGSIAFGESMETCGSIAVSPGSYGAGGGALASPPYNSVARTSVYSDWNNKVAEMAEDDCPNPDGKDVEPLTPGDPNEITGYTSVSGSEHIPIDAGQINYRIEFENDPAIANSSAHTIVVEQTFDPSVYDTSTFKPNDIILSGDKVASAADRQNFVETFDLRPEINVIGEAKLEYDPAVGKARWTLSSLDPLTLEPTDHVMQGILPVNNDDGVGIGSVAYSIALNPSLADGAAVDAKASIIFDYNNAIETPTWHNVTDFTRPVSYVADMIETAPGEVEMRFDGSDTGSGLWRYDLYCRLGDDGEWTLVEGMLEEPFYSMKLNSGYKYSFATVATDGAGNREEKELVAEYIYDDGEIQSGIEVVDADTAIDGSDAIYDLAGRRVAGRLSPGIYIKGNRKILVR